MMPVAITRKLPFVPVFLSVCFSPVLENGEENGRFYVLDFEQAKYCVFGDYLLKIENIENE